MNEIVKKISSYNLFNNLFPWILFVIFTDYFLWYKLLQEDIVLGVFLYYFIWLIISRIWSLIVWKLLKQFEIIVFADYSDYSKASKEDEKIKEFLEIANMYRTLVWLFLSIILISVYDYILKWEFIVRNDKFFLLISLLILFIFSYKKQVNFIKNRVDNVINELD